MAYSYDRSKTAAAGTLLMAKAEWAKGVAELAADRFKSYGGWASQQTRSTVRIGSGGQVELTVRSDRYRWTGYATFDMEGSGKVAAYVDVDQVPGSEKDYLKMIMEMDEKQKVIPINDRATPDSVVEEISLWFSKAVNPLRPID
jgi:hypothetical protein